MRWDGLFSQLSACSHLRLLRRRPRRQQQMQHPLHQQKRPSLTRLVIQLRPQTFPLEVSIMPQAELSQALDGLGMIAREAETKRAARAAAIRADPATSDRIRALVQLTHDYVVPPLIATEAGTATTHEAAVVVYTLETMPTEEATIVQAEQTPRIARRSSVTGRGHRCLACATLRPPTLPHPVPLRRPLSHLSQPSLAELFGGGEMDTPS